MTPDPIQTIFDQWNTYKGQSAYCEKKLATYNNGKPRKWRGHSEVGIAIIQAIRKRMKEGYTAGDLCKSIHNYARVLLGQDCRWSYNWTLPDFLTVKQTDGRLQLWRWLPNLFILDDYQTVKARKQVAQQKKSEYENIIEATDDERKAIRDEFEKRTGKPALGQMLKRVDDDVDKRSFGDKRNAALRQLQQGKE